MDGDRELSDTWTGFTRFTTSKEKAPDGYTWSGGGLTRKQTTSRPDELWPEIWKHTSDASKRKEKQKWAIEKPKLDNARRLRVFTSLILKMRNSRISWLFAGLTEDSATQATLSAGQSGIGFKRAARHSRSCTSGSSHRRILEARLSDVIETATSTFLSALDSDEQATATLYVQKAAWAADEAWQQTIGRLQGPGVANPTIASLEHPSSLPRGGQRRHGLLSAPEEPSQWASAPSAAFTTH